MTLNLKTNTDGELAEFEKDARDEEARLLVLVAEQRQILASIADERRLRLDSLRKCLTPEDFERNGFDLHCDYDSAEWGFRIKSGLPIALPKFNVGDWAWNSILKQNTRVTSVVWNHGACGGWWYSVPYRSGFNLEVAKEDSPSVEYEPDGCFYREKDSRPELAMGRG